MAPPTWVIGQILAAADVNSWFVPAAAYKTGDLARSSATLTADPDLTVAVAANATYMVETTFQFKGTAIGNNLVWAWSIPAGTGAGLYAAVYIDAGGNVVCESDGWTDAGHIARATGAGTLQAVNIRGLLVTGGSPGSVTLNWAASSGTTTLTARSYLVLQRVG